MIMKIDLVFQEFSSYLLVRTRGVLDPAAVREALGFIQEKAQQTGYTRILIDGMDFTPPRNDIDRFLIGESIAELLGSPLKMAAIVPAQFINKLAENTAVNRGADLYICGSEAEALRWLLKDLPESGSK
jgi:hypothetical protein